MAFLPYRLPVPAVLPHKVYATFTNGRDCRVKWRCLAQNKVKLAAASSQLYATRLLHSTFWNAPSSG
ncbi:hypothetical protein JTE90_008684 [Oedothorax gibbosus]|uniref:Uncharacterized protein n=1 Tax=Oedothorax gibbosus TaxID=931172 RepID=A0AAV6TQM3_9ARAC|nr:hypothetical protein JTE90_008684 [Oedothorax gibbosus]